MSEDRKNLDLPDRRKNTYAALETKIDEHAEHLEDRLKSFFQKALAAFSIIGITSALSLFGFAYVLGKIKDTREDFVRAQCTATNKHNKDTSASLIAAALLDEQQRSTKAGKLEVRRRRDVTLGLINALAPRQDCEYLVKLSVGEITPTPAPKPKPIPTPISTKTP